MELAQILTQLRQIQSRLARNYGVQSMSVFGSTSRGTVNAESDVDILVDIDPSIALRFVDLAEELEAALGVKVDLVSRRALKPRFLERIQNDLVHV